MNLHLPKETRVVFLAEPIHKNVTQRNVSVKLVYSHLYQYVNKKKNIVAKNDPFLSLSLNLVQICTT